MNDLEYAFAAAYIKTIANKMLTRKDLEQLMGFGTAEEAIKFLKDRGYGGKSDGDGRLEGLLQRELETAWQEAYSVLPEGAPVDILLYQNDFHNLKTVLKAMMSNAAWEELVIRPCIVEPQELYDAAVTADFGGLPEFIRDTAEQAYERITSSNDGQLTELLIDKQAFAVMRKRAGDNRFLAGWVELNIFLANLKTAVRGAYTGKTAQFLAGAMLPSEQIQAERLAAAAAEGIDAVLALIEVGGYAAAAERARESMSAFEKWCDNQRMEYLKDYKNNSFGVEPILAFLIGKQSEIQAVRMIVSGKENRIPEELIRERLRELYV